MENHAYLSLYKKHLYFSDCRKATVVSRLGVARRFLEETRKNAAKCSYEDIHLYISGCKETLKTSSVQNYSAGLKVFFTWMQQAGHMDENITELLPIPKIRRYKPRPTSEEHLLKLLSKASPTLKLAVTLAAYAGLRRSEICHLRREDFIKTRRRYVMRIQGKGGHERIIPASKIVMKAIRSYGPGKGYILKLENGDPMPPGTLSARYDRLRHSIGVDATLHQLRHRFGTRLYQKTLDIRAVQEMLGHMNLSTTEIYTAWAAKSIIKPLDEL